MPADKLAAEYFSERHDLIFPQPPQSALKICPSLGARQATVTHCVLWVPCRAIRGLLCLEQTMQKQISRTNVSAWTRTKSTKQVLGHIQK